MNWGAQFEVRARFEVPSRRQFGVIYLIGEYLGELGIFGVQEATLLDLHLHIYLSLTMNLTGFKIVQIILNQNFIDGM